MNGTGKAAYVLLTFFPQVNFDTISCPTCSHAQTFQLVTNLPPKIREKCQTEAVINAAMGGLQIS